MAIKKVAAWLMTLRYAAGLCVVAATVVTLYATNGLWWYDPKTGNVHWIEWVNVTGTPGSMNGSFGWASWWEGSGGGATCYEMQTPLCNYADVVTSQSPDQCGDERDAIIAEYQAQGLTPRPFCASFTLGGGYGNFMFPQQLNDGQYAWGIVRDGILYERLDVTEYFFLDVMGNTFIRITSGYRNPARNASIPGSASTSRHMFGDAADMMPTTGSACSLKSSLTLAAQYANASYIKNDYGDCHVHADWRSW